MKNILLSVKDLQILHHPVSLELRQGELCAVIGPNRSGKTTLGKALCGVSERRFHGTIDRMIPANRIAFADYTADSYHFHYANFYYQQRYNQSDVADLDTIADFLQFDDENFYHTRLYDLLLPLEVLNEKLIELSSGETRKVLLLKTLFRDCDLYVLDNPLTGLDTGSVSIVTVLLQKMVTEHHKTVVILMNDLNSGLEFDHIIELKGEIKYNVRVLEEAATSFYSTNGADFKTAFRIDNRELKVGNKVLLRQLSWEIRRGEKWLLRGANGSGKSTLMSLLNADNPLSYSLGIELFDRRRGTGESIWEIKSKVGFVSPEIQLYWNGQSTVKNVIQSGFTGTLYLNRRLGEEELMRYQKLLSDFGLSDLENNLFAPLSTGDKRIVVVARAMVQNPPLLILDEPFQGLDSQRFKFLQEFLNRCADESRTVIQIAHTEREILPCIKRVASIEEKRLVVN